MGAQDFFFFLAGIWFLASFFLWLFVEDEVRRANDKDKRP